MKTGDFWFGVLIIVLIISFIAAYKTGKDNKQ